MKEPGTEAYALFSGGLELLQPRAGPRTSVDAVLLADFLAPGDETLAELGLGNGAASLAALYLRRAPSAWGIEIQPGLAGLAELNARTTGLPLEVKTGDLRRREDLGEPGRFTRVIANPPFRRPDDGRRSPSVSRDAARREVFGGLQDFLDAARLLLAEGGRFTLIYPARRLAELAAELRSRRLEPRRMRLVHPSPERPAGLVLLEAVKGGGAELEIPPPLYTHGADGAYTDEMAQILAGRRPPL
ncbi:MAG TPA: SAM-dependent methyltransferase [Candidatus Coatesbacteria bacterium]|nr:SAM-dependent methyltransferase [Candidatus Coatesbacteria bacterium]